MNIDFGRSVTYPFEDRQWTVKVGILLVASLIPGLNLILLSGYGLTIARNILRGEGLPMPDWSNWSDIAVRGLLSIVATFMYFLPALLVSCCGFVMFPSLSGRTSGGVFWTVQCCSGTFAIVYSLIAFLLLNAGHIRYAQSDQFASYLEIGPRVRDVQRNAPLFLILLAIQIVIGLVTILLGAILFITCIGLLAVVTFATLINGYILGQTALSLAARPQRG